MVFSQESLDAYKEMFRRRKAEEAACDGIPTYALEAGAVERMREALETLAALWSAHEFSPDDDDCEICQCQAALRLARGEEA